MDGIVYNIYKEGLIVTLEVAKQMSIDKYKVSEGISRPVFVDARKLKTIAKEARSHLSEGEGLTYVSGGAILINNAIQKLLANAYLSINKPLVPAKIFTDKNQAISWLQQFKNIN
ncbi:MAG: hypothetical protein ACK4ND_08075 [Cytophagaceae bacterium]